MEKIRDKEEKSKEAKPKALSPILPKKRFKDSYAFVKTKYKNPSEQFEYYKNDLIKSAEELIGTLIPRIKRRKKYGRLILPKIAISRPFANTEAYNDEDKDEDYKDKKDRELDEDDFKEEDEE